MFDLFGEMDSAREINNAAEGFLLLGDTDSIFKMCKENGIPEGYAHMYIQEKQDFLCDVAMAAIGKIQVEQDDMKLVELMADWAEYIKGQCLTNEELATAVRRKGKSLKGCIAHLLKWSFSNKYSVDKDIIKAAGINNANVSMGIPGMGTAKKLIKQYYLG